MNTPDMALTRFREEYAKQVRDVLKRDELSEQQWRVIAFLSDGEEADCALISEKTCILGPSFSRIKNRLTNDGFIACFTCPADKRVELVALTARGKRLFKRLKPGMFKATRIPKYLIKELNGDLKEFSV